MILRDFSDQAPDDFREVQRHLIQALPMLSTFARREVLASVFQSCADHQFSENAMFLLETTPVTIELLRESLTDGVIYHLPEDVISGLHDVFGARSLAGLYLLSTEMSVSASSDAALRYAFKHYAPASEQLEDLAAQVFQHPKTPPELFPVLSDCLRTLSPASARRVFSQVLNASPTCQLPVLSWVLQQPEAKPTQQMLEESLSRFRLKVVRLFLQHGLTLNFKLAAKKLTALQLGSVWHDLSDYQTLSAEDFQTALDLAITSSHFAALLSKIASHPNSDLNSLLEDSPILFELRTEQHIDDLYELIQYGFDEHLLHPDDHLVARLGSNAEFRQYRLGELSVLDMLLKHGDGEISASHVTVETRRLLDAWNAVYAMTADVKKTKHLMSVTVFREALQNGVSITPAMLESMTAASKRSAAVL